MTVSGFIDAAFTGHWRAQGRRRASSRLELIGVVLDHGVGEKLLAHALDFGARLGRVVLGQLDLDKLALAHIANRAEAERVQGVAMALPCGSSTPFLSVMVMRAFMSPFV